MDGQAETAEASPKTEAGRKLIQWAGGLEKWSEQKVSKGDAIGVLGGLAVLGAGAILYANGVHLPEGNLYFGVDGKGTENGGFLDLAKMLVQSTKTVNVGEWGIGAGPAVGINLSSEDRKQLVDELLNLEKFESFKQGAATAFFLAGMGLAALSGMGEKESGLKRSTSVIPGVAKAMASLGKML